MNLSVVVPTKNRPTELRTFLKSLWSQNLLPDQLIIIDQSLETKHIKEEVKEKATLLGIKINYIHDKEINGLVQAKAAAIPYNECSIISFFEIYIRFSSLIILQTSVSFSIIGLISS